MIIRKRSWEETRKKKRIIEETLEDLKALYKNLVARILGICSESVLHNASSAHDQIRDNMGRIGKVSDKAYCHIIPLTITLHGYLEMYQISLRSEKLRFFAFLRGNPLKDITFEEFSEMRNKVSKVRRYFEEQGGRYDEYVDRLRKSHETSSEEDTRIADRVEKPLYDILSFFDDPKRKSYDILHPSPICCPGA